jgi:hypothetical protein
MEQRSVESLLVFANWRERHPAKFLEENALLSKFPKIAKRDLVANGLEFVLETNARTSTNVANSLEKLNAENPDSFVFGKEALQRSLKDIVAEESPNAMERNVFTELENAVGLDSKLENSGFTNASGANSASLQEERNVAELSPNATDSKDARIPTKDADGLDQSSTENTLESALLLNSRNWTSRELVVYLSRDVSTENVMSRRNHAKRLDRLWKDNLFKFVHGRNWALFPRDVNVANGSICVQRNLDANNSRRLAHLLDQFTILMTRTNANGPKSTNSAEENIVVHGRRNALKTNATRLKRNANSLDNPFAELLEADAIGFHKKTDPLENNVANLSNLAKEANVPLERNANLLDSRSRLPSSRNATSRNTTTLEPKRDVVNTERNVLDANVPLRKCGANGLVIWSSKPTDINVLLQKLERTLVVKRNVVHGLKFVLDWNATFVTVDVQWKDQLLAVTSSTNANGDQEPRTHNKDIAVHGPRNVLERAIARSPPRNANGLVSRLPPTNITDAHGYQLERIPEERNAAKSLKLATQANAKFIPRNVDSLDQLLLVLSKTDANGFTKNTTSSVQREDNVAELKKDVFTSLENLQNAQLINQFADGLQRLEFATIVFGK